MNVLPQVYDYLNGCANWYVFKSVMFEKDDEIDQEYGDTHINAVYLPLRRTKPFPLSVTCVEYGDSCVYYFFRGNEDLQYLDIEGNPTWEDVLDHIYKAWNLDDDQTMKTEATFDWTETA